MADPASIDLHSQEIRFLPVTATDPGTGAPVDLSGDVVEVALTLPGERPADADWVVCAWSTDVPGSVELRFNLSGGFDLIALGAAYYLIWVRVTDAPERPILSAFGGINVTSVP